MNDIKKSGLEEITQHTSPSKIHTMRKYDLMDLLTISLYNTIIFSGGLGLGWFVWNN